MEKSLRIELLKSTINPPLTVAIKCISKSTLHQTPVLIGLLRTEVELLQSLNHESIVKMYGIVENVETIGIVMEKIMGIELLNYLQQNDKIADMESRAIFKQLLLGISKKCIVLIFESSNTISSFTWSLSS